MPRELRLNAFVMNTPGHLAPGLWAHPRDRSTRYTNLRHWADLARLLEEARFDGVFVADVLGVYDVYRRSPEAALARAAQVPANDPLQLVPAMALVTEHLGFGITCSVSFEHPHPFARRMSTMDHLTGGRAAWNIVASYLDSGAKSLGQAGQRAHDDRYEVAEDYLELCYKLWEGSWEDGAVVRDADRRLYADPARVHRIRHDGPHFQLDGLHLCEPSPQRTPVLYQAGTSRRGRAFAGRHAECVFVGAPTAAILKAGVAGLRAAAAAAGRDPRDLLVFAMMTAIVAESDRGAEAKLEDYRAYASEEGALALLSGWTGLDLGAHAPDEPLRHVRTEAGQSAVESFSSADPARAWTIAELARWCAIGGRGPVVAGSPATVADALQAWAAEADLDGFNVAYAVMPGTFEDVARLLVPELQRRGAFKRDYAPGTLREKLFGRGPRLGAGHPAAAHRRGESASGPR